VRRVDILVERRGCFWWRERERRAKKPTADKQSASSIRGHKLPQHVFRGFVDVAPTALDVFEKGML
jgi:hypothetical protein